MNTPIASTLLLTLAAASSFAQAAPAAGTSSDFSLSADHFDVKADSALGYDGFVLGAKARVLGDFSIVASYADADSDSTVILLAPAQFKLKRYSVGVEGSRALGSGNLTYGIAYAATSTKVETGGSTQDYTDNSQFVLGIRYELELGAGFRLALGAAHFLNDPELSASGASFDMDDVTAPYLTVGYAVTKAVSVRATYSTEDMVMGLPSADRCLMLGVHASF